MDYIYTCDEKTEEMEGLQLPPKLQLSGNVAENWRQFKQRFLLYLSAIDGDRKSEKMKASLFLHVVGDEALEVYNNFTFEEGESLKLQPIMDQFEAFCIPKRNVTYERHRFFTCMQKSGETIDQYVTELKHRSKTCEFGELKDSLVKDRIVCGIPDNGLRERLLREQDLDLEKALSLCRAAETVKTQAKELLNETCAVDVVKKYQTPGVSARQATQQERSRMVIDKPQRMCDRCGMQHPETMSSLWEKLQQLW